MNTSGVILLLVAAFLIYKIQMDQDQTGGSVANAITIANRYQDPYYSRQYRELDDVDNVLNRPQTKGDPYIDALVPWNQDQDTAQRLRAPVSKYLDFNDDGRKPTPTDEKVKVLVEGRQPYFLDEALIIDRDGKKFYWDWRYPRRPISLQFATDPEGYVRDHPNEYPSYVIASRNYSALQPNDPASF